MSYLNDKEASLFSVTSLLMTDVGDQICWCRVWDASDKSLHQHQELGTSIKYESPTSHLGVLWAVLMLMKDVDEKHICW